MVVTFIYGHDRVVVNRVILMVIMIVIERIICDIGGYDGDCFVTVMLMLM